jgi:hypothetical protein
MISKKTIIALASGTIVLFLAGCVSFESDVFASASVAPTFEAEPAVLTQAEVVPNDDAPSIDLALVSPR